MTINVNTLRQQTQEFLLRLFVAPGSYTAPSSSDYCTCTHVGTHARLHG